ncbi:MAG: glycosyltransferase family 4 protein [Gemmataceae bacterium]
MDIAFCYESVLPERGGCETYIADLARMLVGDNHVVHLYACRWDADSLPQQMHYHRLDVPHFPRFFRPWRFGRACLRALREHQHDVSIGFDKTWGQDVLYPQGGLHAACAAYNLEKHYHPLARMAARCLKNLDPAFWSFLLLERQQYLISQPPLIVVNSRMVQSHFQQFLGLPPDGIRIVPSAIDPDRFHLAEQPRRRLEWRKHWHIDESETVGLFVAMNYRLKGLDPLLHAVRRLPTHVPFRLLVVGNRHKSHFERLAARLGIARRVTFLGPVRDVQNCYFAADFLVHPTFYDPCSLVVLEALTCGLPVITTRANGASELLHPPMEGYVIDNPHDHDKLAWCIRQLFDPIRRKACSQAARVTASRWTFANHYRQLMQVLEEAAARRRQRAA